MNRGYNEIVATAITPAYRWYDYALRDYLWVMDVDLGGDGTRPDANTVVKAVPISDASHSVHKAGPGTKIRLVRLDINRPYEIVGLASIVDGQVVVIEVTYDEDGSIALGTPETYGSVYRALNFTELGTAALNGGYKYGTLPYGTLGKYDASGNLVYVIVVP
jgi:hypothetical protein